jgi:hypothetical protein
LHPCAHEDDDLVVAPDREVVAAVVVEVPDGDRPRDRAGADGQRPLEAAVPPARKHRQDRSRHVREDDVGVVVLRRVRDEDRDRRFDERDPSTGRPNAAAEASGTKSRPTVRAAAPTDLIVT